MTSISTPTSPLDDLASWKAQQRSRATGNLLTTDLIALAQSGVSVSLASSRANGRPIVGMGIGCRVRPDGTLRIILSPNANADFLDAVAKGRAVAVTFSAAPDHRAFQVKASQAKVCAIHDDDRPEMDRQCALFRDGLVTIGFPMELANGIVDYDTDNLAAIELKPERVFTQTPGPGAGAELVP
jgi:hypothetical protein